MSHFFLCFDNSNLQLISLTTLNKAWLSQSQSIMHHNMSKLSQNQNVLFDPGNNLFLQN